MKRTRSKAVLGSVLATACLVAACSSSGGSKSPSTSGASSGKAAGPLEVVVGADIAKTGYISAFDLPAYQTLTSNLKSSTGGPSISLKLDDNQSAAAKSAELAQSLVGNVKAMVISCSGPIGAAATAVTQAHKMVAIATCSGSKLFGPKGLGSYVYGLGLPIESESAAMAEFTASQGWKRAYVLEDTSLDYSQQVCAGFTHRYQELGGTIAGKQTFKNGDQSITAQISKIRSAQSNYDAVVLCSYPPGGAKAVLQLRQAGVNKPIVSHYGMDGAYWTAGIHNLSNFFAMSPASIYGDDPVPAVNALASQFKTETGQAPSTGTFVFGADVAIILRAAIQKAGTADGPALNTALENLGPVKVVAGTVTIDPTYHAIFDRPVRVIEATNGKFHFLKMFTPKDPASLVSAAEG